MPFSPHSSLPWSCLCWMRDAMAILALVFVYLGCFVAVLLTWPVAWLMGGILAACTAPWPGAVGPRV